MKLLGWVHRKFRREAAAGDPRNKLHMDDGDYPCPQPSLDELRTCCRLNHPRPSLHRRRSFPDDGGYRETSLPDEDQPRGSMDDDHLLLQGLLAIGTLGLDPSCLEGLPPPHLRFLFDSIVLLVQKEQTTSEAAERDDSEPEEVLLRETGDKNGYASFSPPEPQSHQKVEEAGGGGGGGRENPGKKKERTLTGVVKKVLKRRGSKAGAGAVASDGGTAAAPTAGGCRGGTPTKESNLYKLLKIFHKKVHPQGSIAQKKHKSPAFNIPVGVAYSGGSGGGDDEAIGFSRGATRKEGDFCRFWHWTHLPELASRESSSSCGGDSNGSGEHWIKTDRDYLVLEL